MLKKDIDIIYIRFNTHLRLNLFNYISKNK